MTEKTVLVQLIFVVFPTGLERELPYVDNLRRPNIPIIVLQ